MFPHFGMLTPSSPKISDQRLPLKTSIYWYAKAFSLHQVSLQVSLSIQQGEVQSPASGKAQPQAPGHGGATQLESGLAENYVGSWWNVEMWMWNVTLPGEEKEQGGSYQYE